MVNYSVGTAATTSSKSFRVQMNQILARKMSEVDTVGPNAPEKFDECKAEIDLCAT